MTKKETSPKSLAELELALNENRKEAESLAEEQVANKREHDALAEAIATISKNLQAYSTEGEELKKAFQIVEEQISHGIECATHHLGEKAEAVKAAYETVGKAIHYQSTTVDGLRSKLLSEVALATRKTEIELSQYTAGLESLSIASLKKRLQETEVLVAEANALTGTSEQNSATQLALFQLATDRLTHSVIPDKTFSFPADYEKAIVDAFNKMKAAMAAAEAGKLQQAEKEQQLKNGEAKLTSLIATQKQDSIEKAVAAV